MLAPVHSEGAGVTLLYSAPTGHVALAHVALVYTVWTLTGVLNSLAHSVMSITTFPQLSFHIATSLCTTYVLILMS